MEPAYELYDDFEDEVNENSFGYLSPKDELEYERFLFEEFFGEKDE